MYLKNQTLFSLIEERYKHVLYINKLINIYIMLSKTKIYKIPSKHTKYIFKEA